MPVTFFKMNQIYDSLGSPCRKLLRQSLALSPTGTGSSRRANLLARFPLFYQLIGESDPNIRHAAFMS